MAQLTPPTRDAAAPPADLIDFGALAATFWHGRYVMLCAYVVALCLSQYIIMSTPRTYQADGLVKIEGAANRLALPESVAGLAESTNSSSMAEIEILKSRLVLGQAAARLRLDWRVTPWQSPLIGPILSRYPVPWAATLFPASVRPGEFLSLSMLQVPPDQLGTGFKLTVTGPDSFSVALPDGGTLDGKVNADVLDPATGFGLRVKAMQAAPGRLFTLEQISERDAVAGLSGGLSVFEQGRQTNILRLTLTGESPDAAQARLDAVIAAYVQQNVANSAAEAEKGLVFVEQQLPAAEAKVSAAERALKDYQSSLKSVDLDFETRRVLSETEDVETALRKLDQDQADLRDRYTESHPVYRRLQESRATLEQRLAELKTEIAGLPSVQRDMVNLTRELQLAQETYVELSNRAQELRILRASQVGSVRVIDGAQADATPIAPIKSRIRMLWSFMGLLAGAGIVLIRRWLDRGIASVDDLELAGFAVYGLIPSLPDSTRSQRPLIARDYPESPLVEAFRSLRTGLHFGMVDAQARAFVVLGTAPGIGKSFCVANLGVTVAQSGRRVCLVDADMRRGMLHRYLRTVSQARGLSDVLSGSAALEDVLQTTDIENLSLIGTGPLPPDPAELLMNPRLAEMLAELQQRFDLIVFDAPPCPMVTDAVVIARTVGTAFAVIRHGETSIAELQALSRIMAQAKVALKGTILNFYDPRRAGRGKLGQYDYGQYARYDRDPVRDQG